MKILCAESPHPEERPLPSTSSHFIFADHFITADLDVSHHLGLFWSQLTSCIETKPSPQAITLKIIKIAFIYIAMFLQINTNCLISPPFVFQLHSCEILNNNGYNSSMFKYSIYCINIIILIIIVSTSLNTELIIIPNI